MSNTLHFRYLLIGSVSLEADGASEPLECAKRELTANLTGITDLVMGEALITGGSTASLDDYSASVHVSETDPDPIQSDALRLALDDLLNASQFLETCRRNPGEALGTGAMSDAVQWVDNATKRLVELRTNNPHWEHEA